MISSRPALMLAAIFALVPLARRASADPPPQGFTEQRTRAGASVVFTDDTALGAAFSPYDGLVKGPPRAARMMLLRPRVEFVSELIKSVEKL
jgi:hypothetical protein